VCDWGAHSTDPILTVPLVDGHFPDGSRAARPLIWCCCRLTLTAPTASTRVEMATMKRNGHDRWRHSQ